MTDLFPKPGPKPWNLDAFGQPRWEKPVVKTAAQMNARRIPTVTELRDFLGSELLADGEGFQVTETDRNGESSVEIAGRTDDGLRFAATIQITTIYEADF